MTPNYFICQVHRPPRWNTFFAGLGINAVVVLLLAVFAPQFTVKVLQRPIDTSNYVKLVAPPLTPAAQQEPPRRKVPVPRPVQRQTPRIEPPVVAQVKPPQVLPHVEPPKVELPKVVASMPAPKPAPVVKTNVFASAKSDVATVHAKPREVQTGGFGDPNGLAGKGDPKRNTVTVASVGSFDLPEGPGKGNGLGGSHGVSGTVRAAGFNEPVAASGPHVRDGVVASSGFGNVVAPSGGSAPQKLQRKPDVVPVEIVFKPRPTYTPEARQHRVQGEVLLDVVFEASGSLHVNRVVKGLGYGLDDMALAAAQRIQFHPALRDGQPYDCAAVVHIVFELAD